MTLAVAQNMASRFGQSFRIGSSSRLDDVLWDVRGPVHDLPEERRCTLEGSISAATPGSLVPGLPPGPAALLRFCLSP